MLLIFMLDRPQVIQEHLVILIMYSLNFLDLEGKLPLGQSGEFKLLATVHEAAGLHKKNQWNIEYGAV